MEIRENKGARVIPMNHATLRDFFLVAPLIYEAVGRLAVQNFRVGQMEQLKACQRTVSRRNCRGRPGGDGGREQCVPRDDRRDGA